MLHRSRRLSPPVRGWVIGLLLLLALAGCQVGSAGPTATPPVATTTTAATSAAADTTTTTATATATTAAAAATTTSARTTPTGSAVTRTGSATAAPAGAGTPSPAPGGICNPEPPFGRATATAAARTGTPDPQAGTPAARRPSIPLPDLEADYTLDIGELRFAEGQLRTAETVRVVNRESCALDRLFFSVTSAQWGWFTLDRVTVDGREVAARLDGTVLPVPLGRRLAPGEGVTVALDFRLDVGTAPDGFAGTTQAGDILRLAYWFPILSDDHQYPPFLDPPYTATADFEVTLTAPQELVVAHTGVVAEERANGDGTVTRRIAAPNVRDFVLNLSPSYQIARRTAANGVEVELYYNPRTIDPLGQNPALVQGQVDATLDAAVLAEERLSELFGQYPYPVLRVVDAGRQLAGGIEFPMLVWVNMAIRPIDELVYHEVAHEWFYGVIGTRTQQDPWIDEGGASFLESYLNGDLPANPPGPRQFAYRLSTSVWEVPAGGGQRGATLAIYTQGEAFYTRVWQAMGDDAFWGALQALYRDRRFGIITPRDLLGYWQAASPVDLRPIFREYLDYPWIDDLHK